MPVQPDSPMQQSNYVIKSGLIGNSYVGHFIIVSPNQRIVNQLQYRKLSCPHWSKKRLKSFPPRFTNNEKMQDQISSTRQLDHNPLLKCFENSYQPISSTVKKLSQK